MAKKQILEDVTHTGVTCYLKDDDLDKLDLLAHAMGNLNRNQCIQMLIRCAYKGEKAYTMDIEKMSAKEIDLSAEYFEKNVWKDRSEWLPAKI